MKLSSFWENAKVLKSNAFQMGTVYISVRNLMFSFLILDLGDYSCFTALFLLFTVSSVIVKLIKVVWDTSMMWHAFYRKKHKIKHIISLMFLEQKLFFSRAAQWVKVLTTNLWVCKCSNKFYLSLQISNNIFFGHIL